VRLEGLGQLKHPVTFLGVKGSKSGNLTANFEAIF
jgi:hypothetical protein